LAVSTFLGSFHYFHTLPRQQIIETVSSFAVVKHLDVINDVAARIIVRGVSEVPWPASAGKHGSHGTTHVIFEPLDFIARLAALDCMDAGGGATQEQLPRCPRPAST
jgi:hypothetical protein